MKKYGSGLFAAAISGVLAISTLLCGCGQAGTDNVNNNKEENKTAAVEKIDNTCTDVWYEIFVYSFCDSNGDGIGDLKGVDEKLDYLKGLGINGIWLMPVCPSDSYHKYDVNDYEDIDPQYGTMADFDRLVSDCHKDGIKVITDMVVNHTGSGNQWFIKAEKYLEEHPSESLETAEKNCKYVGYYNFTKEKQSKYTKLGGTDWYYESQFSEKMPDLNWDSADVHDEVSGIMKFWFGHGVDGFRLDAAREYYSGNTDKNAEVLSWLEKTAKSYDPDAYMVAEVWDTFGTISDYYKSGITSIFDYPFGNSDGQIVKTLRGAGNESRVGKYAGNLEKAEKTYRESNPEFIDAPFLSNHDTGRISGFLNYDEDKMKLAGAMNLFMGGNSFIYYGEELGMSGSGNDPSKRAPMYWSASDRKGMTDPPPECADEENRFGSYDEQKDDPTSIYSYYRSAISIRADHPEIARGVSTAESELNSGCVSAVRKTMKDKDGSSVSCVILYNISDKPQTVTLSGASAKMKLSTGLCTGSSKVTSGAGRLQMPAWSIAILK